MKASWLSGHVTERPVADLRVSYIDEKKDSEAASHLNSFLERNPKSTEGWYLLRMQQVL
jgi:hypothetical protein